MKHLLIAGLAAGLFACATPDRAEIRLQLEDNPPANLLYGYIEGYGGTPGQGHFEAWATHADGTTDRFARFAIVTVSDEDATRQLVPVGTPEAMDVDSGAFLGVVNTQCQMGPCGGIKIRPELDMSDIAYVFLTREPDAADDEQPSDDVLIQGSVQPYARGTLRGSLNAPTGSALPRAEITIIPLVDTAEL